MKLRDTLRKIIKWSAMAITIVFMLCWILSNWYYASWQGEGGCWDVGCSRGLIGGYFGKVHTPGVHSDFESGHTPDDSPLMWSWWEFSRGWTYTDGNSKPFFYYAAPLWVPTLLTGGLALVAWMPDVIAARRRARVGLCTKCGYNRAGLRPDAACPECGTSISA